MILFQLLASVFIIIAIGRIVTRFREARIPKSEVWVWLIFWAVVAGAVWWPKGTDIVANYLGISRGYELIVAASLAILFYLMFKVFSHIHELQYQTTQLIRKLAVETHEDTKQSEPSENQL